MNLIDNKKTLKKSTLDNLINICLVNEFEVIKSALKLWLSNDENNLDSYKECLLDIGALCSGVVYIQNYSYRLAGFILKRLRRIKNEESVDYYFIPVYKEGNLNFEEDPLVFQNCCNIYDDHGFVSDSFGNFIHLDTIIEPKSKVDKYVKKKKIDLNKYLKNNGIYLDKEK